MVYKLSNYLKMYRKRSGFTQKELARLLSCDKSKISYYEYDKQIPNRDRIAGYEIIFDTSLNYLYPKYFRCMATKIKNRAKSLLSKLNNLPSNAYNKRKKETLEALINTILHKYSSRIDVPEKTDRICSIYPITRGYGFAIIENKPSIQIIDWGVSECARCNKNVAICQLKQACLIRFQKILSTYEPSNIVLEICDKPKPRCRAINHFLEEIEKLAIKYHIIINKFSLKETKKVLIPEKTSTRQEIAENLVRQFPELSPSLPRPRKIWTSEDYRMSIFIAVALGMMFFKHKK